MRFFVRMQAVTVFAVHSNEERSLILQRLPCILVHRWGHTFVCVCIMHTWMIVELGEVSWTLLMLT